MVSDLLKNEVEVFDRKKVIVLGQPNRIGQGIEFDYCCVHGVLAAKEMGYETIMINCNPETVSTDFDTVINCSLSLYSGSIAKISLRWCLRVLSFSWWSNGFVIEKLDKYGVKNFGTSFKAQI